MDAEKNVVEAARRVIDWAGRGWPTVFDPLREAIAAYDSAPDPSEDRVREAAGAVHRAVMKWSNDNDDMRSFDEVRREALRPYVTPAPALPEGTVAVPVSEIEYLRDTVSSFGVGVPDWVRAAREAADAITKRLPPPPRPEPPKELVAEWQAEGDALANGAGLAWSREVGIWRDAYVLGRRAAWEANGGA